MNVGKFTTFYECIRTVVKNFQYSVEDKEILDTCNLTIGRDTSYILVCHNDGFLKACYALSSIIFALYDAMYTEAIRKEEQDLLFSHENIYMLKLMVDIRKCLKNGYLQKVYKSNALASCI